MKKRIGNILGILAIFGYMIFIGRSNYMFAYLANQNFYYVWAVIAILWIVKQDAFAKWLTAASVFAVFPAELVDRAIRNGGTVEKANLWGVIVWIALVVLTLISCLVVLYNKWRKAHPKKEKAEEEEDHSEE